MFFSFVTNHHNQQERTFKEEINDILDLGRDRHTKLNIKSGEYFKIKKEEKSELLKRKKWIYSKKREMTHNNFKSEYQQDKRQKM